MSITSLRDNLSALQKRLWIACLPEARRVRRQYEDAMRGMAVAYSYCYLSYDPDHIAGYILRWAAAESQYARLGYRTIGLWTFVGWVNTGAKAKLPLGIKREKGEKPVFYARNYYDTFSKNGGAVFTPEDGPQLKAAS